MTKQWSLIWIIISTNNLIFNAFPQKSARKRLSSRTQLEVSSYIHHHSTIYKMPTHSSWIAFGRRGDSRRRCPWWLQSSRSRLTLFWQSGLKCSIAISLSVWHLFSRVSAVLIGGQGNYSSQQRNREKTAGGFATVGESSALPVHNVREVTAPKLWECCA